MSTGLLSQLRSYYETVDENQAPIRPDEVERLLETVRQLPVSEVPASSGQVRRLKSVSTRRGMQRRWALAAAAVVLVVVAPVLLLSERTGSDSPVATTPRIDSFSSLTWSRLAYDEAVFGEGFEQVMDSVTAGGPGFVAVGQSDGAAVWTSTDGLSWFRVPHNEDLFGAGVMHSVTAGGPGLVAVGTSDQGAVWTSLDGFTWSRVPHDEEVFGGGAGVDYTSMSSVTAGGPGLVAVGIDGHPHGENVNPVVWTSPDGLNWSRVPYDEAIFGIREGVHWTSMASVTAGGPGLVAVGGDSRGSDGRGGAAVWTSVDGITWSRVPHDEAVFDGWMSSVTAGGPGLVAVGWDDMGAVVWTSVDGTTWSRVPHDQEVFGAASMTSVTAGGPGLVAVGTEGNPEGAQVVNAVVWTSGDGITWSRVPYDEAVFGTQQPSLPALEMRSITASGSRFVAVGSNGQHPTFGATRSDAAVWVTEH